MAESKKINALIYRCFEFLSERDERRFVRKFRDQPHDSDQIMHTLRELVLGAYLSSRDLVVRHDYMVDGQTPDWCVLDDDETVTTIIELINFHLDRLTENEVKEQRHAKGMAFFWRDANKDNISRLYFAIERKAEVYRALVEELAVPYVVALHPEFIAAVDLEDDVYPCLFDKQSGLFGMYPETSGLLYFEERSGVYLFRYTGNPKASRPIWLPDGAFPPEM
jgi:hypothetical protein